MKIISLLQKIERIDEEIKDLRKMERSLKKNKSFTAAIQKTIEKQLHILINQKEELLDLEVKNPPEYLVKEFDAELESKGNKSEKEDEKKKDLKDSKIKKETSSEKEKPALKPEGKKIKSEVDSPSLKPTFDQADDFPKARAEEVTPILTQEQIDAKFATLRSQLEKEKNKTGELFSNKPANNEDKKEEKPKDVKLLDSVLQNGAFERTKSEKDRKIKFFRENFPSE